MRNLEFCARVFEGFPIEASYRLLFKRRAKISISQFLERVRWLSPPIWTASAPPAAPVEGPRTCPSRAPSRAPSSLGAVIPGRRAPSRPSFSAPRQKPPSPPPSPQAPDWASSPCGCSSLCRCAAGAPARAGVIDGIFQQHFQYWPQYMPLSEIEPGPFTVWLSQLRLPTAPQQSS